MWSESVPLLVVMVTGMLWSCRRLLLLSEEGADLLEVCLLAISAGLKHKSVFLKMAGGLLALICS